VAGGLCLLNGLLLAAVVRRLLPGEPSVAAAAGVLLVCHRGDPSRFFVMWTTNYYWASLAFLLLAVWLLVVSTQSGRRAVLLAACVALGASLLSSEAGYPLALLGPALLWLAGARGDRLLIWSFAWMGTAGLMAVRLLCFFVSSAGASYQGDKASAILESPLLLLANLRAQSEPFLSWFQGMQFGPGYRAVAALAAAAAVAAVLLAGGGSGERRRRGLVGLGAAAAVALAGVVPFLTFPWVFRTQFYAAPGEAALIAVALGLVCGLAGRRAGRVALAVVVAALAANSAAEARRSQDTADKFTSFVKSVRILQQVHAASPAMSRDTLVLLVTDEGTVGPLGPNSTTVWLTHVLGYVVTQANGPDLCGDEPEFLSDRVGAGKGGSWGMFPYEKVVAFHVTPDGTVSLLRSLPDNLVPDRSVAARYNPLPLLRPGPIRPLRFYRYPAWVRPPQDVIDPDEGLVLGEGWSAEEAREGAVFRRCHPGAELVVNPMGNATRTIRLDLEAEGVPGAAPCQVEVRDEAGKVVARSPLRGRQEVSFTVPTDPQRVSLLSFQARPDGPSGPAGSPVRLRAYAPPGAQLLGPGGLVKREISHGEARIGANWYPLESWDGQTFRWFNTDAVVRVPAAGPRSALVLDAEPGPGVGGQPCRLVLLGPDGEELSAIQLAARQKVGLPVPAGRPAGDLHLCVEGGGRRAPFDRRIMNVRAFSCEWVAVYDPHPPVPPAPPPAPDVIREGLRAGGNWYPVEVWDGLTFRWFATDAELVIADRGARSMLVLDLEPGPGVGRLPASLHVVGPDGKALLKAELPGRRELRVPLPAGLADGSRLRLEVAGVGLPAPGDTRTLNMRAFRCALAP
jgi:hypothetical protein